MIRAIVASACFALAFPAVAEIEKIAIPGENGLAFRWWPKLTPPKGWLQDLPTSFENGVNALIPVGQTFADAPSVMYAKAVFKARVPDVTSLAEMIVRDKQDFLNNVPDVLIRPTSTMVAADGRMLLSFTYSPKPEAKDGSGGNWERVSYLEEGEFYLVFTMSSRTQKDFKASAKAYEKLVRAYREKL